MRTCGRTIANTPGDTLQYCSDAEEIVSRIEISMVNTVGSARAFAVCGDVFVFGRDAKRIEVLVEQA